MPETIEDPVYKERRAHWAYVIENEVNGPLIKGRLREGDQFCAIGVACDIYDPSQWVFNETLVLRDWTYRELRTLSPKEVEEWFGVSFGIIGEIAQMNDKGASPKAIADFIRSI